MDKFADIFFCSALFVDGVILKCMLNLLPIIGPTTQLCLCCLLASQYIHSLCKEAGGKSA